MKFRRFRSLKIPKSRIRENYHLFVKLIPQSGNAQHMIALWRGVPEHMCQRQAWTGTKYRDREQLYEAQHLQVFDKTIFHWFLDLDYFSFRKSHIWEYQQPCFLPFWITFFQDIWWQLCKYDLVQTNPGYYMEGKLLQYDVVGRIVCGKLHTICI